MVGERAESDQRRSHGKLIDEREEWTKRQAKSRSRREEDPTGKDDRPRTKDASRPERELTSQQVGRGF